MQELSRVMTSLAKSTLRYLSGLMALLHQGSETMVHGLLCITRAGSGAVLSYPLQRLAAAVESQKVMTLRLAHSCVG